MLIELSAGVLTAAKLGTGDSSVVTLTRDATDDYYIKQYSDNITFGASSAGADISDNIQALVDVDPDWYGVTSEFRAQSDVEELTTETAAREKLYFVSDNNAASLVGESVPANPSDLLSILFNANTPRTVGFWHQDGGENGTFPECTFMGYNFPFDAGSVNWKNIQLPSSSIS